MKKLLILALVALVAGAAFADTDPVFSGEFSAYWAYWSNDTANGIHDSRSYDASIDLQATIDDYNTVSVSIATEDVTDGTGWYIATLPTDADGDGKVEPGDTFDVTDDYGNTINVTVTDGSAFDGEYLVDIEVGDWFTEDITGVVGFDSTDDLLQLQAFNLTTDITGALGIDGPVSVVSEIGKVKLGAVAVDDLLYKNGATAEDEGAVFTIGIVDMLTVKTIVLPAKWVAGAAEYAFTVEAETPVGNVAAYYITSEGGEDGDNDFDWGNMLDMTNDDYGQYNDIGFSFGTMPIDGLTVMAQFVGMLEVDTSTDWRPAAFVVGAGAVIGMVEGFEFTVGYGGTIIPAIEDARLNGGLKTEIPFASELTLAVNTTIVDGLEANLEIEASGFYGKTKVDGTEVDGTEKGLMEVLEINFDATYALMDNLSVFGALGGKWNSGFKALTYDAGISTSLGALSVVIGASHQNDFMAPEDDWDWAFPYVSLSTSF